MQIGWLPIVYASGPAARPPRGYCTQISRAISPSSRCYHHLIGSTSVIKKHLNSSTNKPDIIDSSLNDDDDTDEKEAAEELVYVRLETTGSDIGHLSTGDINERLVRGVLKIILDDDDDNHRNNLTHYQDTADIRAQISSSAGEIEGKHLANRCRASIESFLCRMAYPSCHFRRSDVSALVRSPCREDCLLLRDVLCSNLDWTKFYNVLMRAFNDTLMSAINVLDLEVQGDLVGGRGGDSSPTHSNSELTMATKTTTTTTSNRSAVAKTENERLPQSLVVPSSYNFKSSIHFYWPHEHSIQRCESLPPLRPLALHATNSHDWRLSRSKRKNQENSKIEDDSNLSHNKIVHNRARQPWPSCSNAHLTKTRPIGSGNRQSLRLTTSGRTVNQLESTSRDCLNSSDGFNYTGKRNRTRSGRDCQKWQDQWPHQHRR